MKKIICWCLTCLFLLQGTVFAKSKKVVLHLVGDSTVASYEKDHHPLAGWGQVIGRFLTKRATVENHAVGGRSSKSFMDEGRWAKVVDLLKKGDYVLIQFGHNDQKKDKKRHTDPESTYKEYLRKYVKQTRAKKAHPVLISSMMRRRFVKNKQTIRNTLGTYPTAVAEVAKEMSVPFVDLNKLSETLFNQLGEEGTKKVFLWLKPGQSKAYPEGKKDNSHFSIEGAKKIAVLITKDIKRQGLPLAKYVK